MSNIQIDLPSIKKRTNKVYRKLILNESRYLVLFGGAGSGKSVFAVQKLLLRILTEQNHKILVVRKYGVTNKLSTFELFKTIIEQWNMSAFAKFNRSNDNLHISFPAFKSTVYFKGLDDPEKIKSIAGVTNIWIEEASELDQQDLDQLDLRLRGETRYYKQMLITFNPVDITHWLKKEFFDTELSTVTAIKTTYKDNEFLDDAYIKVLLERIAKNENWHRIYVLGEWGKASLGTEFYKSFSTNKHLTDLKYDSSMPLHISFDFNVLPYVALTIWQVFDGYKAVLIDEITLDPPRNRTLDVCHAFAAKYANHKAGLFIYGDPTAKKESTNRAYGENEYNTIIMPTLAKFRPTLKLLSKSFPVVTRGNFINSIFEGFLENIEILVNRKCEKSINDLLYCQVSRDGTKEKSVKLDKNLGVRYQQYGHLTDTLDYFITVCFLSEYERFVGGGTGYKELDQYNNLFSKIAKTAW